MAIGFHFDEIECAYFGLTEDNYDDQLYNPTPICGITPIGGFHGDSDDTEDDSCIGGMHGEFREKE
jgi:hypothetical protein